MADRAPASNSRTTLSKRQRQGHVMDAYDRLPPELRAWLAQAALPWSARSALRHWRKTLQSCGGDTAAAQTRLTQIEKRQMSRDIRRIWGDRHPSCGG